MEAKEKAIELVGKFSPLVEYWDFYNNELRINEDILKDAKQCALIAVDEISKAVESDWSFMERKQIFWQEVKIEIEKL